VPDGTLVSPFLNSKDITSGLPFDLVDGFSIAAGEIHHEVSSKIHIMPFVTQVTFVRHGSLTICMREKGGNSHYEMNLIAGQAVLTRPGTFFQLVNRSNESCHVLYIVSPAYLFEMDENGNVIYDDSIVLEEDWDDLKKLDWQPSKIRDDSLSRKKRQEAYERLSSKS
jgi:mannose-6-phosphate isomerase-like protein (cupin superfamily)